MINLEEITGISDTCIFLTDDKSVSVNKEDVQEIHDKSVIRATEYKALIREINIIKCDYLSKMEYHRKMVDELHEKWENTKRIQYRWAADDHRDRINELGFKFDGANMVCTMVNGLVEKYERFAVITQRIIKNKGW